MLAASPNKWKIGRVWSLHLPACAAVPVRVTSLLRGIGSGSTASASSDPGLTAPKVTDTISPRLEGMPLEILMRLDLTCRMHAENARRGLCCRLAQGLVSMLTPKPLHSWTRLASGAKLCRSQVSAHGCVYIASLAAPLQASAHLQKRLISSVDCACRPQRGMPANGSSAGGWSMEDGEQPGTRRGEEGQHAGGGLPATALNRCSSLELLTDVAFSWLLLSVQ